MIPHTEYDLNSLAFAPLEMPSRTYRLDLDAKRVHGFADKREAMRQAIYLAIHTERYQYPIYSRNYGVEMGGLVGRPIPYVLPEIKRRVTEALMHDERVTAVDGWEFDAARRGRVAAAFTAHTVYGSVDANVEVAV